MVEVVIIAEGQTEEAFVKRVLAPAFRPAQIFIKPVLLNTSKSAKGGAVTYERFCLHARNILNSDGGVVLTCLLDLYGLDTGFPAYREALAQKDSVQRVRHLEEALHSSLIQCVGCRPDRFVPHIQPYEFEGLLFSDVARLVEIEPEWGRFRDSLQQVRDSVATPEDINNSWETKPSKRLEDILIPTYRKTRHGPLAAERITLETMERECPHFHTWLETLRGLRKR